MKTMLFRHRHPVSMKQIPPMTNNKHRSHVHFIVLMFYRENRRQQRIHRYHRQHRFHLLFNIKVIHVHHQTHHHRIHLYRKKSN